MGDFNMMHENQRAQDFSDSYHLENLPTCFTSSTHTAIDLFVANARSFFMDMNYHKMLCAFVKATFTKDKRKFMNYRCFKSLSKVSLRKKCPYSEFFWSPFSRILTEYGEILRISPYSVQMRENTDQNNFEYGQFLCSVCFEKNPMKTSLKLVTHLKNLMIFEHLSICLYIGLFCTFKKEKKVYTSHTFITKDLRKVIIDGSLLRNKFNRNFTSENWHQYKRLRNKCTNILKKKKNYFARVDIKSITNNTTFWNPVKFISQINPELAFISYIIKVMDPLNIHRKNVTIFNNYFSGIVKSLNLEKDPETLAEFSRTWKEIKKKLKDDHFYFNLTLTTKLLMLSLN